MRIELNTRCIDSNCKAEILNREQRILHSRREGLISRK